MENVAILTLCMIYFLIAAIRTYDMRIIQAGMGRMNSGVASSAQGKVLPEWVSMIHFAAWAIFIALLVLSWKVAVGLYVAIFILRVLPVMERIGEAIAKPFLIEPPQ